MRSLLILSLMIFTGCDLNNSGRPKGTTKLSKEVASTSPPSLTDARAKFTTTITSSGDSAGPTDRPHETIFDLVKYTSSVGELDAYITKDPGDGQKHPAIIWITGGDNNSIGDVWSPYPRENDQSASAFRNAGIVMMFPSQRGGNTNPGQREGFYGEVDDVLAAADYLEQLPYVDPQRIYLGGHSTGGTLVMLIAEMTDRFQATFSLGPVASPQQYGGDFMYCDTSNEDEILLRSPINWLHCVKKPLFVFEGGSQGNWDAIQPMKDLNTNLRVQFFKVNGYDHFTVIAPIAELLASKIVSGNVSVSESELQSLR